MRKLLTFFFAALMSASMFALTPLPGDTWDEGTKTLTVNSNPGNLAYRHQTVIKHVIISNSVTSIGFGAFAACEGLTSVTIPSSVTSIGNSAFFGCISLKSVTIPSGVTSIGDDVFAFCIGLTSITISNSVESIGFGAFYWCSALTSITIPNSVTSIGMAAFYNCYGLTSITIPNSVTSIGKWAFRRCKALTSIYAEPTTPPTLGEGVFTNVPTSIPLYVPNGSVAAYTEAAQWNAFNIQAIPDPAPYWVREGDAWDEDTKTLTVNSDLPKNAYQYRNVIEHVIISNSVTSIGYGAFFGCAGLTSIVVDAENPNYSSADGVLFDKDKTTLIQCPGGKQGEYTIPNSVTSIGYEAFAYCTGLTSITIPNSVKSIGERAFAYCTGLTSITIPNSVTSIGNWAFGGCSGLTSVTIGNSVTSIGYCAFFGCTGLTSITIPNSVTSIGAGAFAACIGLTSIVVDAENPNYSSADGVLFDKDKTTLIQCPGGKQGEYTIPNSVTSIGDYAFAMCSSLASIEIPNSVISIGESAFAGCSDLTSVTIGNSVTSIGIYAFSGCTALASFTINATTPPTLGTDAFQGTAEGLKIYVPAGSVNTYKAGWAAYADKIKAIPPAWVRDGDEWDYATKTLTVNSDLPVNAYKENTEIEHVIISSGVTSIGESAFAGCSGLTSVRCVRETPASLGNDVFYGTAAALKIYVPAGSVDTYKGAWTAYADKIQPAWVRDGDEWDYATKTLTVNINPVDHAYQSQNVIQHVIINNGVTSVGISAFNSCNGLTSVTIPNSVTSIGAWAFTYSNNLMSITCLRETPASLGTNAITPGEPYDQKIYVPAGSVETYKAAWSYVAEKIKAIPPAWVRDGDEWDEGTKTLTVKSNLPVEAYMGQTVIQQVIISDAVTSIGTQAFNSCSALTSVTIGNSVTSIGDSTFFGCTALPSITIPNSVTSIGDGAFAACTGLTSIVVASENTTYDSRESCNAIIEKSSNKLIVGCQYTFIPNSVTSIGVGAFAYCTGKTSITIPNSVTSIGDNAFQYCSGLTSITIPNSVTSIGNYTFFGCSGLTSIEIPNGVTSIGDYTFFGCSGLTSIEIPNGVTSIGEGAFSGCEGLTSITIPNSVTSIGEGAFSGCSGLTSVTCVRETPASLGNDAFNECSNLNAIYVPCGTLDAYQSSWTQYQSNIKYAQPVYTIIGNVNIAGAGTVILPQTICDNSITASPNYGYHFAKWSDGNTENPRTIELTQDTTFTAEFAYDRTGKCGNDLALTWTYDPNKKVLTISGNGAFEQNMQCGVEARGEMTKVIFVDGVTSIGYGAFDGCTGLTSVTIGNSVTSIGQMAFFGCTGLTSVTIGNSVISIGDNAFQNCSGLTSITIPNSVTRIGLNAFYGCTGLSSIEIPSSVTRIGGFAFHGCTALASVTIHAESLEHYGAYAFDGTAAALTIYVPAGSVDTYKTKWSAYADKIVAIPAPEPENSCGDGLTWELNAGVLTISYDGVGTGVMDNYDGESTYAPWASSYESITSVIISNGVTSIGDLAFLMCSSLASIEIPNSVTSIGAGAFYVCTGLTSVTIPNSVESIGMYAFADCSGLEKVTILAESLESYGSGAFEGTAEGLKIYVPAGSVDTYKTKWSDYADKILAIPAPDPTAIENTNLKSEIKNHKLIKDGQILILRDGKTYTATGQQVR